MVEQFFYLTYYLMITCLVSVVIIIAILSLWYHSIFKFKHNPTLNSMFFLLYPIVKSIRQTSKKKIALYKTYMMDSIYGMCRIFEHRKFFNINIIGKNYFFLFTPDAAEFILTSHKFIERSLDYNFFKGLCQGGVGLSQGKEWQKRRKLLTPSFHFKILHDFVPLMQDISTAVVKEIENLSNEPWINIMDIMSNCSMNIFMLTALGIQVDKQNEDTKIFTKAIQEYISHAFDRITKPWLYHDIVFNTTSRGKKSKECVKMAHGFLRKLISEKKQAVLASKPSRFENGETSYSDVNAENENTFNQEHLFRPKKKAKAFMDLLLDIHLEDESFGEEDIMNDTLNFLIGVTNGTTDTLSYTIYNLGLYKSEQTKVHNELDEIFKNSDREITEDDLKSMKYLECCIKESMRLYPLEVISRKARESFTIYDYTVPRGSIIVIFIKMLHRNPEIFPNPEMFNPTRFLPENSHGRHPYAYIPFSAGARNCIAQRFAMVELKIVIASILRKFSISSMDERDKLSCVTSLGTMRVLCQPR